MEISLLAVGKLRSFYREACDEYLARLARYVRTREVEVREARAATAPLCRAEEARRLLARMPEGAVTAVLTRVGTAWTSAELAERLDRWLIGARPVAFVIGGSTGLDDSLLEQADERWSLGPLTLPHEMARVVVAEQLYRGVHHSPGRAVSQGTMSWQLAAISYQLSAISRMIAPCKVPRHARAGNTADPRRASL